MCKDCRELKGGTPAPNRVSYDLKEVKKDCDYLTATKMRVEGGNYNEKFSLKTLKTNKKFCRVSGCGQSHCFQR